MRKSDTDTIRLLQAELKEVKVRNKLLVSANVKLIQQVLAFRIKHIGNHKYDNN